MVQSLPLAALLSINAIQQYVAHSFASAEEDVEARLNPVTILVLQADVGVGACTGMLGSCRGCGVYKDT